MKKIYLFLIGLLLSSTVLAQTFQIQNIQVSGTVSFPPGSISLPTLATQAPNTVLANPTSSTASPEAFAVPSCTGSNALGYNPGTGFYCNAISVSASCPSILSYGGDNTGTNDNTTAFASTAAANPTNQICVYFPPGTYKFTSSVNYLFSGSGIGSVTIKGAGADVSQLTFPNGGGLGIGLYTYQQSAHIRDLSILAGTANASGAALVFNQHATVGDPANTAQSDIIGVTIRGSDGYQGANYWALGIDIIDTSNVQMINDAVIGSNISNPPGTGIQIAGTSTTLSVENNISNCVVDGLNYGVNIGQYVQGITISQSNFVYDNYGVYVGSGLSGLDQLTIVNSQIGGTAIDSDIYVSSAFPNVLIANNLLIDNGTATGIDLQYTGLTTITGNSINSGSPITSLNGVVVGNSVNSWPTTITGNVFSGQNGSAVYLQSTSSHVNVQSNGYVGNGTNVTNSGTSNTVGGGSQ